MTRAEIMENLRDYSVADPISYFYWRGWEVVFGGPPVVIPLDGKDLEAFEMGRADAQGFD